MDVCGWMCRTSPTEDDSTAAAAVSEKQAKTKQRDCLRVCTDEYRRKADSCEREAERCRAVCSFDAHSCTDDCATALALCLSEADLFQRLCRKDCPATESACLIRCQSETGILKQKCRHVAIECTKGCSTKEQKMCEIECDHSLSTALQMCEASLDSCLVSSSSRSAVSASAVCLANRRLCTANANDIHEACLTSCLPSLQSSLEECALSFEVNLDRCDIAQKECEKGCFGADKKDETTESKKACSRECIARRDECEQHAADGKVACEQQSEEKWAGKCGETCEQSYLACLEETTTFLDSCREKAKVDGTGTDGARICRNDTREKEKLCISLLDECSERCGG
ncbi:hypothetical protein BLNAU_11900 [Blattamonas nauphoetae]|uniref:Four-helix bundle copper-binding protein n=1 Tax=Blattamonas nauphoetae TaxID=2049346 RepID=A0ABQ9XPI8_9EUKA|nr:hypothetical protein BLNAU_11900 [Blattamonas nauphoetae]